MKKGRLEAFSDGVIAIIITIMVLELHVPAGDHPGDLLPMVPTLLSYILSFVLVGIYWNNHHHMLYAVQRIDGTILWSNLHLLFWLSLMPVATSWLGQSHFTSLARIRSSDLMNAGMSLPWWASMAPTQPSR